MKCSLYESLDSCMFLILLFLVVELSVRILHFSVKFCRPLKLCRENLPSLLMASNDTHGDITSLNKINGEFNLVKGFRRPVAAVEPRTNTKVTHPSSEKNRTSRFESSPEQFVVLACEISEPIKFTSTMERDQVGLYSLIWFVLPITIHPTRGGDARNLWLCHGHGHGLLLLLGA